MNQKISKLLRAVSRESGRKFSDLVDHWNQTPTKDRKMIKLELLRSLQLCKEIMKTRKP